MTIAMILVTFAAFLVILFAVALLVSRSRSSNSETEGIPDVLPTNALAFIKNAIRQGKVDSDRWRVELFQTSSAVSHLYRNKGIATGNYGQTIYNVFHQSTIEPLLNNNIYINKGSLYKLLLPWLGKGLLTSSDRKWKKMRKLLTPAFHFHILEDFMTVFNEQSKVLVKKIESYCNGDWIDVVPPVSLCTLDIIGETAMGVSLGAQKGRNSEYVDAIRRLTKIFVSRFLKPWLWLPPILYLSSEGREMQRCLKIIHSYDRMIINERKEKLVEKMQESEELDNFENINDQMGIRKRRTFLDLLLYHHLTNGNISEEEILDEVNTFMFEGHDTTAMGISFTLYLLGCHPGIQDKVYQELCDIFGDNKERDITTEDLKRMKYLERVIKESLRLFPPVPVIIRSHFEGIQVDRYKIKPNSEIAVIMYSLHRDPETFRNPEVFDPDRFLPENSVARHPFAYIPFSAGPRNCIGQRFAMMEEKIIIAHIVRNFTIHSLDHRDKLILSGAMILRAENGIRVEFQKRFEMI